MKMIPVMLLSIGAGLLAASCSEKSPDNKTETAAAETGAVAAVRGHGIGTVTALDPAAGKVTIDHGAIPEANWPAMTMAFEADPAMLKGIKVGDKVQFDMAMAGGKAKVTSIGPQ